MDAFHLLSVNLSSSHLASLEALLASLPPRPEDPPEARAEGMIPYIEEILVLDGPAPPAPADRLRLAAEVIACAAFGGELPEKEITPEGSPRLSFELRLAAVDFEFRAVFRVVEVGVLRLTPPPGDQARVEALEEQLRAAYAAQGCSLPWREHREQLRYAALVGFYEHLRGRIWRGKFQVWGGEHSVARLLSYLRKYLFCEKQGQHYVVELREALGNVQQQDVLPDHRVAVVHPVDHEITHELDVLDEILSTETDLKHTDMLQQWRAFLHGLLQDVLLDRPSLALEGDAQVMLTPVADRLEPDRLRGEEVAGYCAARRAFLRAVRFDGDPQMHLELLRQIRLDFDKLPRSTELFGGSIVTWLYVELAGRREPPVELPPESDLGKDRRRLQWDVQNLKSRQLIPAVRSGLARLGLDPDDYPFIYGSLIPTNQHKTRSQS